MRTRLFSKMINSEIEEYLNRNSIIFVPVGTVELNGKHPLDCEYTQPAGLSLAMAEKVDGIVFDSLKYFYCGATTTGKGTVQVSTRAGYDYLKTIITSLWCQGFREIIMVSGHGPAEMTIVPVIWDFFDETKQHIWWIDQMSSIQYAEKKLNPERDGIKDFLKVKFGCYSIMDCENELVIDSEARTPKQQKIEDIFNPDGTVKKEIMPESVRHLLHPGDLCRNFAVSTGFYYGTLNDHGGNEGAFPSIEERKAACAEGLKQLKVMVELMDMPQYIEDIRQQQKYTDSVIREKYHHLPKNNHINWS